MAQLFPEWISDQERKKNPKLKAEYKVYDALGQSLKGDGWYVFYSRIWTWVERDARRIRTREADFIIAHPKFGILLLEVKGGKIEVVDGRWVSTDRSGYTWGIDPYTQVANATESLVRRLDEENYNPFVGFRFSTAVCFPDVIISKSNSLSGEKHRSVTLDASHFDDLKDAILKAMKDGGGEYCVPGEARILALKELVACSWYIDVPRSVQVKETEHHIKKLTDNQFKLLYELAPSARRLIVSGCAGSGKTIMAAETARRMVQLGRKKILLTCFNRNLATWLRQSPYFVDDGSMMVSNYHKLCSDFATQAGLVLPELQGSTRPENDPVFEKHYPELLLQSAEKMGVQFDAIIVDEAQDFLSSWWTSLILLLADKGSLHVYQDAQQSLRNSTQALPTEVSDAASFIELTENVRNTKAIHDLAMKCHPTLGRGYTALCDVGLRPEFVSVPDGQSEHQVLQRIVDRLVGEEQIPSSDVAILTPLSISEGISAWKPGQTLVGKYRLVHDLHPADHEIFCSSIASAKGLEFPVVIITELCANGDLQEIDQYLQLMYVGLSRARSMLIMLTGEEEFSQSIVVREKQPRNS